MKIGESDKLRLSTGFCNGCCYDNNPNPVLNCSKVKCCYLVKNDCILVDGVVMYRENLDL